MSINSQTNLEISSTNKKDSAPIKKQFSDLKNLECIDSLTD